MKKLSYSIILFFVIINPINGQWIPNNHKHQKTPDQLPNAVLVGPTERDLGKLIILKTTGTIGNHPVFQCSPENTDWYPVKFLDDTIGIVFSPDKEGDYTFSFAVNLNNKTSLTTHTIKIGKKKNGPIPPNPPPDPGPKSGYRVLMIYESSQLSTIPRNQLLILYSKQIADLLESKCTMDPDGKKAYRIWDQNVNPSNESKVWQDLFNRPRSSVPWLIISSDSGIVYEGVLPASINDMVNLLNKTTRLKKAA